MLRTSIVLLPIVIATVMTKRCGAQTMPQRLDTVQVRVASRAEGGSSIVARMRSIEVITREDIQAVGARSVQEALASALAVDVLARSPVSADVAVRGSSLGQVLVLVDGVRMTDRQTPHFDLDLAVPIASVQRIEILRGAASAQYGADAVGGVINVVTGKPDARVALETRAGSFAELGVAAVVTDGAGRGTMAIQGEYRESEGHRAGTDYSVSQLAGSFGSVSLGGSVGQVVRDFGANSFYGPYDSHERTATTTAELHGERQLARVGATPMSARLQLSTRRHLDQFTLRRTDPAFYRNRHEGWQSAVSGVVRVGSALAVGSEVNDARIESARLGNRRDFSGAMFAQGACSFGTVTCDAGVRSDWTDGFGTFVSPSVAVARQVRGVLVRGSANRAFRAPSWTERFYSDPANVGNAALGAERFTMGELGARSTLGGGRVAVDVALWARRGSDVIDWVKPAATPTALWTTMNIATIDYRGADAQVGVGAGALGVDGIAVTAHGTALSFDAASASGYVGKYALRPQTEMVGLRLDVTRWRAVGVVTDVRREKRVGEAPHVNAGASVMVRVRGLRGSVGADNLANVEYLDVAGKPVAGRSLSVALSF